MRDGQREGREGGKGRGRKGGRRRDGRGGKQAKTTPSEVREVEGRLRRQRRRQRDGGMEGRQGQGRWWQTDGTGRRDRKMRDGDKTRGRGRRRREEPRDEGGGTRSCDKARDGIGRAGRKESGSRGRKDGIVETKAVGRREGTRRKGRRRRAEPGGGGTQAETTSKDQAQGAGEGRRKTKAAERARNSSSSPEGAQKDGKVGSKEEANNINSGWSGEDVEKKNISEFLCRSSHTALAIDFLIRTSVESLASEIVQWKAKDNYSQAAPSATLGISTLRFFHTVSYSGLSGFNTLLLLLLVLRHVPVFASDDLEDI
ncbi:hypothetical protein FB451DRAFT_1166588 [Mycena latifolia]|nr:hypothetical protein FB451DRAFT_1166588 [Mycena latifolia]